MKSLIVVVGILPLCLVTASCSQPPASTWQGTVDAIAALNATADSQVGHFDVTEYLSVLDHLEMEQGYTLGYILCGYDADWAPYLYASQDGEPSDYAHSECVDDTRQIAPVMHQNQYLDHIRTDGSTEGFFQLVVLRVMGGQFDQIGHTHYNDHLIVCDSSGLEAAFSGVEDFFQGQEMVPPEIRERAKELDLEPWIEIDQDTVLVRIVVFTKWGGLAEETYTINLTFPHKVLEVEWKVLVPYECGVFL